MKWECCLLASVNSIFSSVISLFWPWFVKISKCLCKSSSAMENNNVADFLEGVVASEIANWAVSAPSCSSSSDESDCSDSFLLKSDYSSDSSSCHCMSSDNESGDASLLRLFVPRKNTTSIYDSTRNFQEIRIKISRKSEFWDNRGRGSVSLPLVQNV